MIYPSTDFLNVLVGMPRYDAEGTIVGNGFSLRVTRLDGASLIGTRDYNPRRVNVWIVDGLITRAYQG